MQVVYAALVDVERMVESYTKPWGWWKRHGEVMTDIIP
jgi:hypothetical protein